MSSFIASAAASAAATAALAVVPEVRARDELKTVLLKQIDGTAEEQAEALTAFIIAEGAAFCKLAQVSAEQPGVVDAATRDALRKVQDACKPVSAEYIKNVIEECIAAGQLSTRDVSVNDLNPVPLGVGSVAQVHICGLNVVKVAVMENLEIMNAQADYLPKTAKLPGFKKTPLANVAKFIQGALEGWTREFDMQHTEGRCLQAFCNWLNNNPGVVRGLRLPEFKAACPRVIVMSRETGRPFKELSKTEQETCLSTVLELASKSLFAINMVHCDPHPGNILFNDENQEVVLLDFGAVSVFPTDKVEQLQIIFSKLPHYKAGMGFETEIAGAMRILGFTTGKNTDKGLAVLASHAFDSRLPAPLEMMKKGEYGDKSDPPIRSFPPELTAFLRFRSVLSGLLAGLGHSGEKTPDDLSLLAQFAKASGAEPVVPSSTSTESSMNSSLIIPAAARSFDWRDYVDTRHCFIAVGGFCMGMLEKAYPRNRIALRSASLMGCYLACRYF